MRWLMKPSSALSIFTSALLKLRRNAAMPSHSFGYRSWLAISAMAATSPRARQPSLVRSKPLLSMRLIYCVIVVLLGFIISAACCSQFGRLDYTRLSTIQLNDDYIPIYHASYPERSKRRPTVYLVSPLPIPIPLLPWLPGIFKSGWKSLNYRSSSGLFPNRGAFGPTSSSLG